MTCAGRSRSRSLARPVSARTRRTSPIGNVPAITPRLMWSLTRMPAGRPAGMRAIVAARSRTSASMAQPCSYVNRIASSPEVKRFAEHMVKDHTAANEKLTVLAKKHKIEAKGTYGTPPLKPGAEAKAEKADLSKMSGQEFDRAYASEMVQDHEKAVGLFRDEAKNGKDKEVSELASSMLPTLEEHLKMARALAK